MTMLSNTVGFLDIPAEVRVEIYHHLFADAYLSLEPAFPTVSHCGSSICRCHFPFGLVFSCRQLHREASSYLLASTTLRMSSSRKFSLLPQSYLSAFPRLSVMNVGQCLKTPLDFSLFTALETLELHNITIWCRYHSANDLRGDKGDEIIFDLALFNVKRHGVQLATLCASRERTFAVLLFCRFVISSAHQETLVRVPSTLLLAY
jgi:hypothetical protein